MFRVKFVYYKILAYPLTDKLYRNYHIYRNSSAPKRAAVCKIFTPALPCKRMTYFKNSPLLHSWQNIKILEEKKINFIFFYSSCVQLDDSSLSYILSLSLSPKNVSTVDRLHWAGQNTESESSMLCSYCWINYYWINDWHFTKNLDLFHKKISRLILNKKQIKSN